MAFIYREYRGYILFRVGAADLQKERFISPRKTLILSLKISTMLQKLKDRR